MNCSNFTNQDFCKNNLKLSLCIPISDHFKVSFAGPWGLMGGRDIKRRLAAGDETSKDFHFFMDEKTRKHVKKKQRKYLLLNSSLHVLMM